MGTKGTSFLRLHPWVTSKVQSSPPVQSTPGGAWDGTLPPGQKPSHSSRLPLALLPQHGGQSPFLQAVSGPPPLAVLSRVCAPSLPISQPHPGMGLTVGIHLNEEGCI